MSTLKVLLVVPCFNEAKRLDLSKFREELGEIDFLFADDGSTDGTAELLRGQDFEVFRSDENLGKGFIIQKCWKHLENAGRIDKYNWIGYWDADLSIPLSTVPMMLKYLEFYPGQEVGALWSSRFSRLGSKGRDRFYRYFFARSFSSVVSQLLKINAYDTQCGAKLFRPNVGRIAFDDPFISRWVFDVEIFLRLRGKFIVEFPLISWVHMEGSKLKLWTETFSIFYDLIRIRLRYF